MDPTIGNALTESVILVLAWFLGFGVLTSSRGLFLGLSVETGRLLVRLLWGGGGLFHSLWVESVQDAVIAQKHLLDGGFSIKQKTTFFHTGASEEIWLFSIRRWIVDLYFFLGSLSRAFRKGRPAEILVLMDVGKGSRRLNSWIHLKF